MDRAELNSLMEKATSVLSLKGFECIETEWNQHDRILRLFIDRESGVDLDACVEVNKILESEFPLDDVMPEGSTLEVSSPGIERPLRCLRHFEKHIGCQITVRFSEKIDGRKTATGRLIAASPEGEIMLQLSEGEWKFPLALVHKASLVYEWQH